MRTLYPLALAIALAMATIMFSMSGMGAYFSGTPQTGSLSEQFNDSASVAEEDIESDSRSAGDLFGYVTSGLGSILNVLGMVLIVPLALRDLGLPGWAATPLGGAIQILVFFGAWQWLAGRNYR